MDLDIIFGTEFETETTYPATGTPRATEEERTNEAI